MSNQKPDGWIQVRGKNRWNNDRMFFLVHKTDPIADGAHELDYKPVMLISPQELSRLRAIEEWVKEAYKNHFSTKHVVLFEELMGWVEPYNPNAITAPEDKEKA